MSWALLAGIAALGLGLGLLVRWKTVHPPLDPKSADMARHRALYDPSDPDRDDREMRELRKAKYPELVRNYYSLTTDILHRIWGPHYSMGILFPVENGKWQTYAACQQMYQAYLALSLCANETMTIGDFGCGTGGPTRCIAQFSGARIKAVNLSEKQLAQMAKWNEEAHIDHQIELVCADYHDTPFANNSLDGVYMCESLAHSPDYVRLCKEVFRVLKPGARFTGFNWELTGSYDPDNPEHRRVRHLIEYGVGVCGLVKMSHLTQALKEAGFEIITQRDHNDFGMSLGGKRWYYMFEENNRALEVVHSLVTKVVSTETAIRMAERVRLVPPGTADAYDLLHALGEGMYEGARQKIFTPMHYWLARKPS
jgi:sterol 24-C-methyltransferase